MKTQFLNRSIALMVLAVIALSPASLLAATQHHYRGSGTISSVDTSAHKLVVTGAEKKSGPARSFQWNDQTLFHEHGKKVNAAALQPGMEIDLHYRGKSDLPLIEKAEVKPAKTHGHTQHHT